MAEDGSAQGTNRPLPKFCFTVDLGDGRAQGFSEISGLGSESHPVEYRHGDSPVSAPLKRPGLRGVGKNVTLKKGVFSKDSVFWDWFNQAKLNIIKRRTVIINLLNEEVEPMMTWTLTNAWPTKMQCTDLKSDGKTWRSKRWRSPTRA